MGGCIKNVLMCHALTCPSSGDFPKKADVPSRYDRARHAAFASTMFTRSFGFLLRNGIVRSRIFVIVIKLIAQDYAGIWQVSKLIFSHKFFVAFFIPVLKVARDPVQPTHSFCLVLSFTGWGSFRKGFKVLCVSTSHDYSGDRQKHLIFECHLKNI